jgi:hypothetical protein
MNSVLRALKLSACVFGLMGFAHLLMLIGGFKLSIGSLELSSFWSLPAFLALFALAWWIHHLVTRIQHEQDHGEVHHAASPAFWP